MYRNVIGWYLQRITGALLIVLLTAHFWVEHFASEVRTPTGLTFEVIQKRFFHNPWFVAIDISFLFIALYHGLNGIRNIIFDFGRVTKPFRVAVTVVLIVFGCVVAYWGVTAFIGNPNFNPMNPQEKGQVASAR